MTNKEKESVSSVLAKIVKSHGILAAYDIVDNEIRELLLEKKWIMGQLKTCSDDINKSPMFERVGEIDDEVAFFATIKI